MSTYSIFLIINSMSILNKTNFITWRQNIMIVLSVVDLNHALRIDQPINSHNNKRYIEK